MTDVNGNITPSGKAVDDVCADDWGDMSVTQLFDQKIILNNRLSIVASHGTPAMMKQIKIGMLQLEAIINSKEEIKYNKNKDDGLTGLI